MKFSKERVEEICSYIAQGLSQKDAVTLSGISESVFYLWKSDHPDNPLSEKQRMDFLESLKRAESENKKHHIDIIRQASEKSWQASAWWLERRYKEEFAVRSEHTGKDGEELRITLDIPK